MTLARIFSVLTVMSVGSPLAACGSSDDGSAVMPGGGGSATGSAGTWILPIAGNSGSNGGASAGPGPAPGTLPAGFTEADVGGYKLGEPVTMTLAPARAVRPARARAAAPRFTLSFDT